MNIRPSFPENKLVSGWVKITLIWLIITGLLGSLLRLYPFYQIDKVPFPFLLHGHSHVAFLGWIFNAFFILIVANVLLTKENRTFYHRLFIALQVTVAGMLILFPLYGYNAVTISISTVHTAITIVFAIRYFRFQKRILTSEGLEAVNLSLKIALIFMLISAAGPLFLAPISILGMKDTIWYNLAIYFYLHFQYNGWFFFAMTALFFLILSQHHVAIPGKYSRRFIWLNAAGTVPAYALSVLWISPPWWIYALSITGTGMQLFTLFYLYRILKVRRKELAHLFQSRNIRALFILVLVALILRNIFQFTGSFPDLSFITNTHRLVIIAFLHLIFLGMITPFLMGMFMQYGWVEANSRNSTVGILLFLTGMITTELLLFASPYIILPFTQEILLVLALLTTAGLAVWATGKKSR